MKSDVIFPGQVSDMVQEATKNEKLLSDISKELSENKEKVNTVVSFFSKLANNYINTGNVSSIGIRSTQKEFMLSAEFKEFMTPENISILIKLSILSNLEKLPPNLDIDIFNLTKKDFYSAKNYYTSREFHGQFKGTPFLNSKSYFADLLHHVSVVASEVAINGYAGNEVLSMQQLEENKKIYNEFCENITSEFLKINFEKKQYPEKDKDLFLLEEYHPEEWSKEAAGGGISQRFKEIIPLCKQIYDPDGCGTGHLRDFLNSSCEDIVEKEMLLLPNVSHFFLDQLHMGSILGNNNDQKIVEKMSELIDYLAVNYNKDEKHAHAAKQMFLRLKLLENDIIDQHRETDYFKDRLKDFKKEEDLKTETVKYLIKQGLCDISFDKKENKFNLEISYGSSNYGDNIKLANKIASSLGIDRIREVDQNNDLVSFHIPGEKIPKRIALKDNETLNKLPKENTDIFITINEGDNFRKPENRFTLSLSISNDIPLDKIRVLEGIIKEHQREKKVKQGANNLGSI